MSSDLATRTPGVQISTMDDVARVSKMFADSGLFADARDAAQAGVRILAGAAWGIDPFTAMSGIFIIKGKPSVSAGLMAAAVKGHPKYDYRVRERSATACRIEFFEGGESLGVSEYTMEMAKRAGLTGSDMYRKHPEAMLFARAMSVGVRTFCPDVFHATVYTPDELGANVDDEGNVLDVPVREAPSRPERSAKALAAPVEAEAPEPVVEAQEEAVEAEPAPVDGGGVTDKQLAALGAAVRKQELTPDQSRAFLSWVLERPIASARDLTKQEASRVIGWTPEQWSEALADYAVALEGGPPEDGPDFGDLEPVPAGDVPQFDPSGKAERKPRKAAS